LATIYSDLGRKTAAHQAAVRAAALDPDNIEYEKLADKLSGGITSASTAAGPIQKQAKRKLMISYVVAGLGFLIGLNFGLSSGVLGAYLLWATYWGVPVVWRPFWKFFARFPGLVFAGWLLVLLFFYIPLAAGYMYGALGGAIYQFLRHQKIATGSTRPLPLVMVALGFLVLLGVDQRARWVPSTPTSGDRPTVREQTATSEVTGSTPDTTIEKARDMSPEPQVAVTPDPLDNMAVATLLPPAGSQAHAGSSVTASVQYSLMSRDSAFVCVFSTFSSSTNQPPGQCSPRAITRGSGVVTVSFTVTATALLPLTTNSLWLMMGTSSQFPQPFLVSKYQDGMFNWVQ